ncbi:PilZ domain-containing protein [Roseomonas chloroacetimidivorans]|uniref:PilZ domain-containing protein n=1 Tax=Roseomonas chloroacetimidivorans TaxID=1766656 RepID=UPI003C78A918
MERRRAARLNMLKATQIVFGDRSLDCALTNLSLTGAGVRLFTSSDVPERVILRLPKGQVRVAQRCWQRDHEIGFEFLSRRKALTIVR